MRVTMKLVDFLASTSTASDLLERVKTRRYLEVHVKDHIDIFI
jgi:hypothetical protein